jgi:hypothetical protein
MPTLVFIDTNIFLNFYRLPSREALTRQLEYIDQSKDGIIITSQVEMEFKKSRQGVLWKLLDKNFKASPAIPDLPPILANAKAGAALKTAHKKHGHQHKNVKQRIVKLLGSPRSDPVYVGLNKLFRHPSSLNLTRENKHRYEIRRLARHRWIMGYPPRKPQDNSIGDAINWEWIVHCAKARANSDVVVVSRDHDFGTEFAGESYLNDWLEQEFKERVGRIRKISLTERLTDALKQLGAKVTEKAKREEQEVIASAVEHDLALPIQPTTSSGPYIQAGTLPLWFTTRYGRPPGVKGLLDEDKDD